MSDLTSVGSFRMRRRSSRWFPEVHKPHVLRSITLSKASLSAYSAYRSNMTCFILFLLHVMYLCIMCRVLLIDDDRLHGSTLPCINHT
jgi:hypothetical protein